MKTNSQEYAKVPLLFDAIQIMTLHYQLKFPQNY